MKIRILAVGRLKEPHFAGAAAEYLKRLKPYADVEVVEVADRDVTKDEERALAEEAEALLRVMGDSRCVALDAAGPERTSEEFSEWMSRALEEGGSRLTLVIGGAAGLHARVLERCAEKVSLSRMTLPHQLARVVLLEQVYRAFRIARGEPYHR